MLTVVLRVVDFVGRDQSTFIADLNEYYAELPKKSGRRYLRRTQVENLLKNWETRTEIKIDDDFRILVYLNPLPATIHQEEQELVWDREIDIVEAHFEASGCVFVVANDERTWNEASSLISQFREYRPRPFVLLVQNHVLEEGDTLRLRQGLGLEDDVLIFAYQNVLRSILQEIIKALLLQMIEEME